MYSYLSTQTHTKPIYMFLIKFLSFSFYVLKVEISARGSIEFTMANPECDRDCASGTEIYGGKTCLVRRRQLHLFIYPNFVRDGLTCNKATVQALLIQFS